MKHNNFTPIIASWVFLLALFLPGILSAQADCMCKSSDPNNPGILHPKAFCSALFDEGIMDDLTPCTGPYTFYIIHGVDDTLAFGPVPISVDLTDYLGQTIRINVVDGGQNNGMCTTYFTVIDDSAPILTCPNDTITCNEFPDFVTPVFGLDNCNDFVISAPSDVFEGFNLPCQAGPFFGRIIRTYTATDDAGNVSLPCEQEVYVLKSDTTDIEFPLDTLLDCSEPFDTSVTGRPTLLGLPLMNSNICNLEIFPLVENIDTFVCGNLIVSRTWNIVNTCTGFTVDSTQIIQVVDTISPIITCPSQIIDSTDVNECVADLILPIPVSSDVCSGSGELIFSATIPGYIGNGLVFQNVPKGSHNVTYTVADSCNNTATCNTTLNILDTETPSAVCEGDLIVILDNNGFGVLFADNVDEGSNDNCTPMNLLDFMVSRDGDPFSPFVNFTCNDAQDSVLVTMEVIDTVNPTSRNTCETWVNVFDQIAPALTCPVPETIDCEDDYTDLSVFGQPFIFDACGFTVVLDSTITIGQCGTGTIERTWTVTDPTGNVSTCPQVITVANQTPYDGSGIDWPDDYTDTNGCTMPNALEPSDLPTGFDFPIVPSSPCSMIATSYSDQLFHFDFPACYKIVRTWKVMDWCQYNSANPTVGIWEEQQVIAIMDSDPPVITSCPGNETVGLNNDCTFGQVGLATVTASGTCSNEDVTITNDSPYANANGADASGNYPEGVHIINFLVVDGCGNETSCSTTVTVTDLKKPSPYCKDGIVGELQFMPNAQPEIMAVVNADQLNLFSSDNCTADEDLVYTMRLVGDPNPPTAPSIVFDCAGEGVHDVEIWIMDEAGNSDFCITEIIIQDNMDLCMDDTLVINNVMIGGGVLTHMGEHLPEVHIDIDDLSMSYMTDDFGAYEFENLDVGGTYSVEPWKNDDPRNGISTYDLVLITRHILNTLPLDSPYKIIAADVNNSGAVSTYDVVELRKMILQIYWDLPNNESWRFVRSDYIFPDPDNPFDPPFPEVANLINLNNDVYDTDFIGVKIGDVNGSAIVNFSGVNPDNRSNGELNILLEDRYLVAGEAFTLPVRLERENNLLALQFTLEFETDLELQGIEKGAWSGVAGDRFDTSLPEEGALTGVWYNSSPVLATTDDVLFSLRFKAKKPGRLSELLQLTSRFTEAVAYDEQEIPLNMNLLFSKPSDMQTNLAFQLHQNQPNPFKKVTNIGFTLPETCHAQLNIYDIAGNMLRGYDQVFEQGYNEVSIKRQELPVGGVLYYQLQTPTNTATKKMILLQ